MFIIKLILVLGPLMIWQVTNQDIFPSFGLDLASSCVSNVVLLSINTSRNSQGCQPFNPTVLRKFSPDDDNFHNNVSFHCTGACIFSVDCNTSLSACLGWQLRHLLLILQVSFICHLWDTICSCTRHTDNGQRKKITSTHFVLLPINRWCSSVFSWD